MDTSRNYNLYATFFAVYETLNMSRAAELLNLASHANVSKSIKQLEAELGMKLFNTSPRGAEPTPECERLYKTIRPLFDEIDFVEKNKQLLTTEIKAGVGTSSSVFHIATGGTIDGELSIIKDSIVPLERSFIVEYLKKYIKPSFDVVSGEAIMKDSREINKEDVANIVKQIMESSHENILVTHGLYTITGTARHIKNYLGENTTKKIIITGSFHPLVGGPLSDAAFNLGFAIASFGNIEPGVHIAMHGTIYNPDEYQINFN
ncbi:MAG: asparaginase domain-containing protein [Firmicutes bacterium]|nr:asparaginase domain-containing protein [Bacillota bacterium]